jgi:SAM-dependent MidA family methyltransferase
MAHHLRALQKIHQQIEKAGGAISFEDYMQAALYMPGYGYYRCGSQKFGVAGDFVTAPEISPLFAQCLARFALQTDLSDNILEVGAGSGVLAANLLRQFATQDMLPQQYFILELSAELRARQHETIQSICPEAIDRVHWLDKLPEDFTGVVLANELLDAMPVRRFHLKGENVYEQYVCWHDGIFCYQDKPSSDRHLLARITELKAQTSMSEADEYLSEINFMAEDWIRSLADSLTQAVVLLIDYGYPRNAYYHAQRNVGTLMCHYQHRAHPDPLILTTLQDITAYIDFTAMADAALESGMEVCGFTTQAHFLLNMGILDELDSDIENWPQHLQQANQVKKLTLPNEMGENFKVMALARGYDHVVPGFTQHDLRHLL